MKRKTCERCRRVYRERWSDGGGFRFCPPCRDRIEREMRDGYLEERPPDRKLALQADIQLRGSK